MHDALSPLLSRVTLSISKWQSGEADCGQQKVTITACAKTIPDLYDFFSGLVLTAKQV